MTNKNNTTLYTGVTNDIYSRVKEHQRGENKKSFSSKYNLVKLVYYEGFFSIEKAIKREKYIKGKSRLYKKKLIEDINPKWEDLLYQQMP